MPLFNCLCININHFHEKCALLFFEGQMQVEYEHCVPKSKDKSVLERIVVVFRQGDTLLMKTGSHGVSFQDNNWKTKIEKPVPTIGHPHHSILMEEGQKVFPRATMMTSNSHRSDRRGVCGNQTRGCSSVVMSRNNVSYERDRFKSVTYAAKTTQGAKALWKSYKDSSPIRVFQSSSRNNGPTPFRKNVTSYRYDGLYRIKKVRDNKSKIIKKRELKCLTGNHEFRFKLKRCPCCPRLLGGKYAVLAATLVRKGREEKVFYYNFKHIRRKRLRKEKDHNQTKEEAQTYFKSCMENFDRQGEHPVVTQNLIRNVNKECNVLNILKKDTTSILLCCLKTSTKFEIPIFHK